MSNVYSFQDMLQVGKWAEEHARQYFQRQGHTVKDVRDEKEWREKDVDFIVYAHAPLWIEVKGDRYTSGNFYIETAFNGNDGCMLFTRSDWIFYYFINLGTAYLINTHALQDWLDMGEIQRYPSFSPKTPRRNGDLKSSLGYIIPIGELNAALGGDAIYQVPDLLPTYSTGG